MAGWLAGEASWRFGGDARGLCCIVIGLHVSSTFVDKHLTLVLTLTIRHALLDNSTPAPAFLAYLAFPHHPPRNPRLSLAVSHDQKATVRG
jgi:hypothetical protein